MISDGPVLGIFRDRRDVTVHEFKADFYKEAFIELVQNLEARGVNVVVLMGQTSYLGDGGFSRHWKVIDGDFVAGGRVKVDLIFSKDHFKTDGKIHMVNHPELDDICWEKARTYDLLKEFQPKTFVAHNIEELRKYIRQIKGDMVSIKPLSGSAGEGVFVGYKSDIIDDKSFIRPPVLVQEFVETSAGISGITDKRHDLRLIMADGEIIACTLRTPPEGSYKSNLSYGGESKLLDISFIPSALVDIALQIDKRLEPISPHRLYSADFGLSPDGWKLFELNSMPGTISLSRGKSQAEYYQNKLADHIEGIIKEYQS